MITLRDYQQKTINQTWNYLFSKKGNPCVVLPTGAGKSIVIAKFIEDAIKTFEGTTVLMATHQQELVEQDAEKLKLLGIPTSIYSAGLKSFEIGQITFASIQSIYNHINELPVIDVMIIDEAHLINHNDSGRYRKLIAALTSRQPNMRIIGFTATPYRLGHGLITDAPAIFNDLIESVSIEELQAQGYLSKLTSKSTKKQFDTTGVKKRGGDYVESDLQKILDQNLNNEEVVEEIIARSEGRTSWIIFCSGVNHAQHIRDLIIEQGITCECITGNTPSSERKLILDKFKRKEITALTNANVLTTGFDAPCVDLIALVRPTLSPGLYVQMVGRGLRIAEGKENCLVLDFAGNVIRHGPITDVNKPKKKGEGDGVPPCKCCPECLEIVPMSARVCPSCGYEFPKQEKTWALSDADIQSGVMTMIVTRWRWTFELSKAGNSMLVCTWYGAYNEPPIKEFFLVWNEGWVGQFAIDNLEKLCIANDIQYIGNSDVLIHSLNALHKPKVNIEYKKNGKYFKILAHRGKNEAIKTN